jgi:hypothetical protein
MHLVRLFADERAHQKANEDQLPAGLDRLLRFYMKRAHAADCYFGAEPLIADRRFADREQAEEDRG